MAIKSSCWARSSNPARCLIPQKDHPQERFATAIKFRVAWCSCGMNFLLLVLGVALLTVGGEALIRGSLAAARRLGVSPLLSGLVIVGFGTSAPELVVSVDAALNQQPDIAIGNVVGSNIGNILLILGICALITPLAVKPMALRRDAVTVVAASILFMVLVGGSALGPVDAVILLISLVAYLVWAYWSERFARLTFCGTTQSRGRRTYRSAKVSSVDCNSCDYRSTAVDCWVTGATSRGRRDCRALWGFRGSYRPDVGSSWYIPSQSFQFR